MKCLVLVALALVGLGGTAGPARATDCPAQVQAVAATAVVAAPVFGTVAVAQPVFGTVAVAQPVVVQSFAAVPVFGFGAVAVAHPGVTVVRSGVVGVRGRPQVVRQRSVIRGR